MSEVIQGSKSSKYIKEAIPGISDSADSFTHQSVQNLWDGRGATDTLIHALYIVNAVPVAIESGSVKRLIKVTGHGASKGDFLRFASGSSDTEEVAIIKIVDANYFVIAKEVDAAVGDLVHFLKAVTPTYNKDGSLNVVAAPGDLRIQVDGVSSIVNVDTITPANTVRLPVEIYSASGLINVTAGDINVQLTDTGANPDITKIGNGVNRLDINASNEALVHDASMLTAIGSLLTELQLKADLTETQPTSQAAHIPTYNESLLVTNTAAITIAKPVGAKGCKVICPLGNTANINITLDGTVPTSTVGMEIQGGRSEDFIGVSDLKAICTTVATGQKISVHWYV